MADAEPEEENDVDRRGRERGASRCRGRLDHDGTRGRGSGPGGDPSVPQRVTCTRVTVVVVGVRSVVVHARLVGLVRLEVWYIGVVVGVAVLPTPRHRRIGRAARGACWPKGADDGGGGKQLQHAVTKTP